LNSDNFYPVSIKILQTASFLTSQTAIFGLNIVFMKMNVYITFPGCCEEAVGFYQSAIHAELLSMQRFGDAPMGVDEATKSKILHCTFMIGETKVMCSDTAGRPVTIGDNFSLAADFESEAALNAAFHALSEGGIVTMPVQETFWGAVFGMCRDKFGINWMFNYDKPKG
jgi:PhnB protein